MGAWIDVRIRSNRDPGPGAQRAAPGALVSSASIARPRGGIDADELDTEVAQPVEQPV